MNCKTILKKMCFSNAPSEEMEAETESATTENDASESTKTTGKGYYMFLGDTVPSFYRRPNSSKDGLFTLIPCGNGRIGS